MLKRRRFPWLVILMGVSLAGMAGLQAYWLDRAVKLRYAQLDWAVRGALRETASEIEMQESYRMVLGQFNQGPAPGIDSMNGPNFSFQVDFSNLGPTLQSPALRHQELKKRMRQADSILQHFFMTGFAGPDHLEHYFEQDEIDSILKSQLLQRGIDLPYQFAVVKGNQLTELASSGFDPQTVEYRVPITQGNFFAPPYFLLLDLKSENKFVFSGVFSQLLLSLLFSGTILFAFWRTYQGLQNQKRVSDMKSDFINNMTHEFKTPIATISLATDALNSGSILSDSEKRNRYLGIIRQENARMLTQVEKVLKLAMVDRGELELNQQVVDLMTLISSGLEHLKLQIEQRGGRITVMGPETPVWVLVDEVHFGNVIVNLVENALKYSEQQPVVTIKVWRDGLEAAVAVMDRGKGIRAEDLPHIFDRFYRERTGNVHDVKGHGLGLSYVKAIVEMHGGSIQAESTRGKGSTFTFKIPLNPVTHEQREPAFG
jgi:signal transduction histidine kinase